MSIPITKRVMMGGSKKGCGCPSSCSCGKAPAKKALVGNQKELPIALQNEIIAAPGKMYNSPAKQSAYPKNLRNKMRNAESREERQIIKDRYIDSVYTKHINDGNTLSPNRTKILEKIRQRQASRSQENSPAKMGCYGKKK